jgi:hypothetical protein
MPNSLVDVQEPDKSAAHLFAPCESDSERMEAEEAEDEEGYIPSPLTKPVRESGGGKVRISLDISQELFDRLQWMAAETKGSKADVLRKSLALMETALRAKRNGKKIGLASKDSDVMTTEIIGLEF